MDKADRPAPCNWHVELDPERCSLCEVCARDCPTGALRTRRAAEKVALLFKPDLCDGCPDGESCQLICPEQAIVVKEADRAADAEEVLLVESAMVRCSHCEKEFASSRKLDAIARKGQEDLIRDLCPLCRREHLVVEFIEERRVPGAKAEYRSTRDILRKAGHHPKAIRK